MRKTIAITAPLWAALLALGLLFSGESWACVPQPFITISPRASGPAGSQVTVEGSAIKGDVEIRWNGLQGMQLGKVTGPTFSAPVIIPDVAPGLYVVVVLERNTDGGVGDTGRAAFLVTGPGGAVTPSTVIPVSKPAASGSDTDALLVMVGGIVLLAAGAAAGVFGARRWRRPRKETQPA